MTLSSLPQDGALQKHGEEKRPSENEGGKKHLSMPCSILSILILPQTLCNESQALLVLNDLSAGKGQSDSPDTLARETPCFWERKRAYPSNLNTGKFLLHTS